MEGQLSGRCTIWNNIQVSNFSYVNPGSFMTDLTAGPTLSEMNALSRVMVSYSNKVGTLDANCLSRSKSGRRLIPRSSI